MTLADAVDANSVFVERVMMRQLLKEYSLLEGKGSARLAGLESRF